MQFTQVIAAAILAFTSTAAAGPIQARDGGLSLTQKLFLADSAADRFALLPNDKDFIFDFNKPQDNPGKGGEIVGSNRKNFPALVSTGASMAVGRVGPCGLNTFHVHPRSVELQIVTEGRLITEMVPENGVNDKDGKRRVIRTELKPYMMTPFYQGSVHTQFNPDCGNATFVAAFANEEAGTGQIADETFAFSDDLISAAFGGIFDGAEIDKIRAAIPKSIARGVDECLAKCHIPRR